MSRNIFYPLAYKFFADLKSTIGTQILNSGGAVVSTSIVKSNSVILTTPTSVNNLGIISTSNINPNTQFLIISNNFSDASNINWFIMYNTSDSLSGTASPIGIPFLSNNAGNMNYGRSQFSSGSVTINTGYAPNNKGTIFASLCDIGSNFGIPYILSTSAGTSFTINSTNASDNSFVNWIILTTSNDGFSIPSLSVNLPKLDSNTFGTATFVNGAIVVPSTSVIVDSKVIVCIKTPASNPSNQGIPYHFTPSNIPGVSFALASTHIFDDSVVFWWLLEPSDQS